MAGVKITASQVQPIKGYEQLEAVTKSDGTFRIKGLFPSSAYVLKPWSDKWTSETAVYVESAPQGETAVLPKPMVIARVFTRSDPSLVADIATGDVGLSAVEGKLMDWKGKPVAGVKIIATQSRTVKGYERFEAVTGSDGSFRLPNLLASSRYVLKPLSAKWSTKTSVSVESPSHHGETAVLPKPMVIARAFSKSSGSLVINLATGATRFTVSSEGVIIDSQSGLMLAAQDNGGAINWSGARAYCQNYSGGGHSDWRMPTQDELAGLYDQQESGRYRYKITPLIKLSGCCPWGSEHRGSEAAYFNFFSGKRYWYSQSYTGDSRALPVRGGK